MSLRLIARLCASAVLACAATVLQAQDHTDRVIVKWREAAANRSSSQVNDDVQRLASRSGVRLDRVRGIGGGMQVLRVAGDAPGRDMARTLAALRSNPEVEFAEPDRRVHAHALTPSDPGFTGQWFLKGTEIAAIRAWDAWDLTRGGSSPGASAIVVAIIDTGVRFEHPDLRRAADGGKLLTGYDFVSADKAGVYSTANDGDGWDADPTDPGDFLSAEDLASDLYKGKGCGGGTNNDQPTNSSWHGTRVAGLVGADTDNGVGVAGAGFNLRVLPVRALGKCGGYDSDVLAAMYWSAGLSIPAPLLSGAPPVNANPAKIINMSLGGTGACSATYAEAVRDITAHGTLIVVSAGNEGSPVDSPANCPGAMGVGGLRHAGTKVGYSNLGPEVGISAPAGNCVLVGVGDRCLYSLDTTSNAGRQAPGASSYTDQLNSSVGTSFSSPLVAASAGLMLAVNPRLTPSQLIARLKASANTFPTRSDNVEQPAVCHVPTGSTDVQDGECICTTAVCGAGMLNAAAAVQAAALPAAVAGYTGSIGAGRQLTLDASASGASQGRSIASFQWTVIALTGGARTPAIAAPNQATTSIESPVSGSYTVRLTVTDSAAATDTAEITIAGATTGGEIVSTTPPAAAATSGGGGGALAGELALLALLLAARGLRRRFN